MYQKGLGGAKDKVIDRQWRDRANRIALALRHIVLRGFTAFPSVCLKFTPNFLGCAKKFACYGSELSWYLVIKRSI